MVTIKDKPNGAWGFIWGKDLDRIYYEDGTSFDFNSNLIEFDRGQKAGTSLADISDVRYLNWLIKIAVDSEDIFLEKCARFRLLLIKK